MKNYICIKQDFFRVWEAVQFTEYKKTPEDLSDLKELKKEFKAWCKDFSSLQQPVKNDETEKIRKRCISIAKAMLRDGLQKVFKAKSDWWDIDFKVIVNSEDFEISYRDYGQWYALPKKYELENEIKKLLQYTKSKKLKKFDLSISSFGIVSINKDKELVLTGK